MRVVGAVCLTSLPERFLRLVVIAAHEMDLRQRVEDGAGRLVEEHPAPDVERPMKHIVRARQRAKADADLSQCRERHREAVAGRILLVQRDTAFGQRQRLFVAMANHRHVRLVPADDRDDVVGADRRGDTLGLTQRRQRFVVAALLRQRAAVQRVHQRERPLVANGVQRRGGLAEVLGHDRAVADVLVAAGELEMRQAGGAQVVRHFALLERAPLQRDGARLIAARRGEASVEPPEMRQRDRRDALANGVRGAAQRGAGLGQIVLQKPGFGEDDAHRQFVVPREGRRAQRLLQELNRLGAAATLERGLRSRHDPLQRGAQHGRSISRLEAP